MNKCYSEVVVLEAASKSHLWMGFKGVNKSQSFQCSTAFVCGSFESHIIIVVVVAVYIDECHILLLRSCSALQNEISIATCTRLMVIR